MTTTPPDIPRRITWAFYKQLSPDEEREFLCKQAEFEAAYRRTGDPLVLWNAILHAWSLRQTLPNWLMLPFGKVLIEQRTDEVAERHRERMRHIQRYIAVRNLRRNGHTKDSALNEAVDFLAKQRVAASPPVDRRAVASRRTIEASYDKVERSLKRQGRESEFFYLVALVDERVRDRAPNPFV